MKTLEEAIEHAEQVYKENHNVDLYARKRGENSYAERCRKCAEEHRQLAEWLRELLERRKQEEHNKPCALCETLEGELMIEH